MDAQRRELGNSEKNWCLALEGGTGITVSAFLFGRPFSKATIQAAVNKLLSATPFLNTQIVSSGSNLCFELSEKTPLVEEVDNPFSGEGPVDSAGAEEAAEVWLKIVESELNQNFPKTKPSPIFHPRLYDGLPDDSSLVIFRMQSSAVDMTSTGRIALEFLNGLIDIVQRGDSSVEELLRMVTLDESVARKFEFYKTVENGIPKGSASKSIWAHGTDVLGYGIVAKRQAYLPFSDTEAQRNSRLIRLALSKEATDRLMKACKDKATDLYGAVSAAAQKSVASFKNVGKKGEQYIVTVLHDCRTELDPQLPENTIGYFQSALLKSTQVTQEEDYWQLAAKCSSEYEQSIKSKKHFTDMGNLNMLMLQAIQHPKLTPSATLRTSLCSILHEPIIETIPGTAPEVLQLKDIVSASSANGIGPCLAIFPFLRHGALHLSFVFCSPLFPRKTIQTLVDSIVSYISV